jgi:hypothetical protein
MEANTLETNSRLSSSQSAGGNLNAPFTLKPALLFGTTSGFCWAAANQSSPVS